MYLTPHTKGISRSPFVGNTGSLGLPYSAETAETAHTSLVVKTVTGCGGLLWLWTWQLRVVFKNTAVVTTK